MLLEKQQIAFLLAGSVLPALVEEPHQGDDEENTNEDSSDDDEEPRVSHYNRKRRPVREIFAELGPHYVRRAYRMDESSFWGLLWLTKKYLGSPRQRSGKKKHKDGAKNGLIKPSTRLSAALRYFAGGRPEDICLVHGILHTEDFTSIWRVIDAVNQCPQLHFEYPADHDAQREIARAFQDRSRVKFDICVGAIDGMLLWIEKPTEADCKLAKCGSKKFFCGRKKRFGLNFQGICDAECRFLDVSIGHPGATSDILSFTTSEIFTKLETPGFLAPNLSIFGDSAYVNTPYMATPYKSVRSGPKDWYNYYQSQVR